MSDEDLQSLVHGILTEAVDYCDNELSPEREEATQYYLGKPFGNEEEGRSQIVMTEVRDAINGMIPGLLRVFWGPERQVEFAPRRADTVEQAAQATEFVQKILEDNDGFLGSLAVLKDGLVRRLGAFKYWVEDATTSRLHRYEALDEVELSLLSEDDSVEITSAEEYEIEIEGQKITLTNVEARQTTTEKRFMIAPIPPEELIYTREGRSKDSVLMIGHRTMKTRGELVAMGIDADDIDEHAAGDDATLRDHPEELARRVPELTGADPDAGEANEKIQYVEAYTNLDVDGDGIAELRKICTIGPNFHVVHKDPTPRRPFALFCPYPEPHTITGQSAADLTMDLQYLQSGVVRAIFDSAASAIFPRTSYVEGQVSVEDILNTAIGAPIRTRAPGMIQEIAHSFIGKDMLPLVDMVNDRVERRTGQNKGAAGLDADALQSSTKQGVTAAVTASQAQQEMIARIFAEMTLKPLFKGLLELIAENPPRRQMLRMRGKWAEIDPRSWDVTMDVQINVALGSGFKEERIANLMEIKATQENILTTMGVQNPFVTPAQYSNTLRKLIELGGHPDVDNYINAVPADWQPPQPTEPPQPSPEQQLVEVEKVKAQISAQHKQQELQQQLQQQQAEAQLKAADMQEKLAIEREKLELERERLQIESELKLKELELKYQVQLETSRLEAEMNDARERDRIDVETAQKERDSQRSAEIKERDAVREHDRSERDSQRKHELGLHQTAVQAETAEKTARAKQKPAKPAKSEPAEKAKPKRVKFVRDADGRLTGVEDADNPENRIEIVR